MKDLDNKKEDRAMSKEKEVKHIPMFTPTIKTAFEEETRAALWEIRRMGEENNRLLNRILLDKQEDEK